MTISALLTACTLAGLALLLAVAVVSDLRSRRIPNRVVIYGIALASAWHGVARVLGQPPLAGPDLLAPLLGIAVGGLALLPLYLLRACGAGDVKLMAMVGAFVGPQTALWAALWTLLAGGVLSLAVMFGRRVARQTLRNLHLVMLQWVQRSAAGGSLRVEPIRDTAFHLPYAVAIAAGTLAALLRTTAWPR